MPSDMQHFEPTRPWSELIDQSRRRGDFLRRRRRLLQVAPVMLLAPLALLSVRSSAPTSLRIVEQPASTPSGPVAPKPVPTVASQPVPGVPGGSVPQVGLGAGPVAPAGGVARPGRPGQPEGAQPAQAMPEPQLTSRYRNDGFTAQDARGDAYAGGVESVSLGAADIVRVAYSTNASGLHLTIEVAEAVNADVYYYKVYARSDDGCHLEVYLGGPTATGFYLMCGLTIVGEFTEVDSSVAGRRATITIPHKLIPPTISPTSELGFLATTENVPTGRDVPARRFDSANTSRTLRRQ